MKTPDEIKADAATCLTKPPNAMCDRFDLNKKCKGDCGYVIKELYDLVLHYESRLARVERERDAAVEDLSVSKFCALCEEDANTQEYGSDRCHACLNKCNWRWRGVCAENTKED